METINEAADKGFGTRKPDDPDYDFYREIRMNNAVFAAFKVHRAQTTWQRYCWTKTAN